jgi:hypothetical protein
MPMDWNTYNQLFANPVPELGDQPFSSISTFAVWQNANAQPPHWPQNEREFDQLALGQVLKQSVVIVGLNPSDAGPGPIWGNYHVQDLNDYRLATAMAPGGILNMLNGSYMTDLLKTVPGAHIDIHHIPQNVLEMNAMLLEQELNTIHFGDHHIPVIIFLGETSQWMFDQIVEKTNLNLPSYAHYWIYHQSARIADNRRNQRNNRVSNWLNQILLSHNIAVYP